MKYFKTDVAPHDGTYWWRANETDDEPATLQVCNGVAVDIVNGVTYEHTDFSGEWLGPITPEQTLLLGRALDELEILHSSNITSDHMTGCPFIKGGPCDCRWSGVEGILRDGGRL